MFKFLKNKIREAVSKITKKIEEKEKTKKIEETEPKKERKTLLKKLKQKITTTKIDEKEFEELFWNLEIALLENNVAFEVIEKLKEELKTKIVGIPLKKSEIKKIIVKNLKGTIGKLLDVEKKDLIQLIKKKKEKPFVIMFVGINGSGKTTTIAKIANLLKKKGISCVMVASDTFRAASIEQLEHHARNLGIRVVKHQYGADPAAVAYDGIAMAKARHIDVVLIDTAGRQHSNINLIAEMQKISRVAKPDLKVFVGEAITGNDCIEQMRKFNEAIGIDAIILTKADVDEKGGVAISISYVSGKPIIYLGIGQELDDIEEFDKEKILRNLNFS